MNASYHENEHDCNGTYGEQHECRAMTRERILYPSKSVRVGRRVGGRLVMGEHASTRRERGPDLGLGLRCGRLLGLRLGPDFGLRLRHGLRLIRRRPLDLGGLLGSGAHVVRGLLHASPCRRVLRETSFSHIGDSDVALIAALCVPWTSGSVLYLRGRIIPLGGILT